MYVFACFQVTVGNVVEQLGDIAFYASIIATTARTEPQTGEHIYKYF